VCRILTKNKQISSGIQQILKIAKKTSGGLRIHQSKKKKPERDPRELQNEKGQSVAALLGRSGAPKGRPRDPQERQKGAQESSKTLSRQSLNKKNRYFKNQSKIVVFEVPRVILGAENRPQEAPRDDQKQFRRSLNNKRREEGRQERQKETTRGHATH